MRAYDRAVPRALNAIVHAVSAVLAACAIACGRTEPDPRGANAHGGSGAPHAGGIVSLSPALTHTAQALGAGDRIVGRTAWCDAPAARIVGSLEDRDLEAIVALRPALVLRQSSVPDPALEAAVRSMGARLVEVRAIDRVRDVEDAAASGGLGNPCACGNPEVSCRVAGQRDGARGVGQIMRPIRRQLGLRVEGGGLWAIIVGEDEVACCCD